MKHGDKAKATASKASGKKTSAAGSKSSKAAPSSKAKQSVSAKAADPKKTSAPAKAISSAGNDKQKSRPPEGGIHFTNAAVGAAFKRAVKKFPNAFRRLTD